MTSELINESISQASPSRPSALQEIENNLRNREEKAHLESDLRLTLEEIARLQNALADTQMQLVAYQKQLFSSKPPTSQQNVFLLTFLKDLSQQITTIQGYAQLLNQSKPALTEMQEEYLLRMADAAALLMEMSSQISKGHFEQEQPAEEPHSMVNFSTLLTQIISPKVRLLEQKQITLQPIISDRIPEFKTDRSALIKIVDLLLSNALTVTPVDSIVKITANTINIYKQRVLQITIKDGGPGMNLNDLDHLLAKEVSLDEILPGLSIPRSHVVHLNDLIESHKGSLEIRNGLDYGTIFEVHLPMD
jgi:signal transduction histidine kinase